MRTKNVYASEYAYRGAHRRARAIVGLSGYSLACVIAALVTAVVVVGKLESRRRIAGPEKENAIFIAHVGD